MYKSRIYNNSLKLEFDRYFNQHLDQLLVYDSVTPSLFHLIISNLNNSTLYIYTDTKRQGLFRVNIFLTR